MPSPPYLEMLARLIADQIDDPVDYANFTAINRASRNLRSSSGWATVLVNCYAQRVLHIRDVFPMEIPRFLTNTLFNKPLPCRPWLGTDAVWRDGEAPMCSLVRCLQQRGLLVAWERTKADEDGTIYSPPQIAIFFGWLDAFRVCVATGVIYSPDWTLEELFSDAIKWNQPRIAKFMVDEVQLLPAPSGIWIRTLLDEIMRYEAVASLSYLISLNDAIPENWHFHDCHFAASTRHRELITPFVQSGWGRSNGKILRAAIYSRNVHLVSLLLSETEKFKLGDWLTNVLQAVR